MAITIAVAGKGGVGKTTLAALMVKFLILNRGGSILAVDADPSTNLNIALGMDIDETIGDVREGLLVQVKSSLTNDGAAIGTLPGGITKREFLDYHIRASVVEGDRCDLIAMGRSEGPGCYCAVNHNLREVIDTISKNYRYVIIDNEAGMEHLSRRTTRDVEHLIIVSEPTQRSLVAAQRIAELSKQLDIRVGHSWLVLNRTNDQIPGTIGKLLDTLDVQRLGEIPSDPELTDLERSGGSVIDLRNESPVYRAVEVMMSKIV